MKNYVIILASGIGSRYGGDIPKQFLKISGTTILEHTVNAFEESEMIDEIIVVITPEYHTLAEKMLKNHKKISKLINGGETRQKSSYIGVNSIEDSEANVLIHDCARPFVTKEIIKNCINALNEHSAVAVAIPSTDTIIKVNNNYITDIPERNSLMQIQTPQCFKLSVIKKAHELTKNNNNFTDDCGLVLKNNLSDIYVISGDRKNIKITYPEDITM